MKHLMQRLVCLLVAVALITFGGAGAGLIASSAAMTGSDVTVTPDNMKCGTCTAMPGALAPCTGSQCIVTGIVPGVKVTVKFQRAAYWAGSEPMPRGCKYRPPIFPA